MFDRIQTALAAIFTILALFNFTTAGILNNPKAVKQVRDAVNYDRYLLATSWAGSTCKFHDCTHYGSDEIFNLHGLWPSTANRSPQNCMTVHFKEENLTPYLKQNLFTYWNSFYHENWEFLDHEIVKHGSCWRPDLGNLKTMDKSLADIIETYDSSDDYSLINTFLTLTIKLSMLINPYKVLKSNGIEPSDTKTYNIDDIIGIYERINNKPDTVMPVCLAEKSSGKLYIAELRFCIDLNFLPIECSPDEMRRQLKRCRESPLVYPSFPHP